MTINFGTVAIAGAYLGTSEVTRMYLGDVLVYGELPTTTWEYSNYTNGILTSASTKQIADGSDRTFTFSSNGVETTLTIHSTNNTAGAAQTVSIVVAGNTVVDHATWTVGTTSEVYLLEGDTNVQWEYPENYTIAVYITQGGTDD